MLQNRIMGQCACMTGTSPSKVNVASLTSRATIRRIVCVVDISGNIRCTCPERPIKAQFTSTAIRHITSIAFYNKQSFVLIRLVPGAAVAWQYSSLLYPINTTHSLSFQPSCGRGKDICISYFHFTRRHPF